MLSLPFQSVMTGFPMSSRTLLNWKAQMCVSHRDWPGVLTAVTEHQHCYCTYEKLRGKGSCVVRTLDVFIHKYLLPCRSGSSPLSACFSISGVLKHRRTLTNERWGCFQHTYAFQFAKRRFLFSWLHPCNKDTSTVELRSTPLLTDSEKHSNHRKQKYP